MNADEIAGLVRTLLNTLLTGTAATAYVSGSQAVALSSAAGALVTIAWSIYAKRAMRLVPETAVVTSTASTVAAAKALSIPAGK